MELNPKLRLSIIGGIYQIVKIPPTERIPVWASSQMGGLSSITRTSDELSIVSEKSSIPKDLQTDRDWTCLGVEGPLDFSLTGILHSITSPLKDAKIPLFAISTFDTDYILVETKHLPSAKKALIATGHTILN